MVTEIIAAGAMGVSVFFAVKAHSLLKEEQAKETPRPAILRSITVFMGFALLMTPLALGIEYARHRMNFEDQDHAGFAEELKRIENKSFYSLNQDGNPEGIEVKFEKVTYQLGTPFPATSFKATELKLKKGDNQQYLAVKDNNGTDITFGYLSNTELREKLSGLFASNTAPGAPVDEVLESEKLMSTGLMYTPPTSVRNEIRRKLDDKKSDGNIANRYLVDFVDGEDLDKTLQGMAVKLLIQPSQMSLLDTGQYDKLIAALSTNGVRNLPYRYYELAQVYLSRWSQQKMATDLEKYKESLQKYVGNYEAQRWLNADTLKYATEYAWYLDAQKELGN